MTDEQEGERERALEKLRILERAFRGEQIGCPELTEQDAYWIDQELLAPTRGDDAIFAHFEQTPNAPSQLAAERRRRLLKHLLISVQGRPYYYGWDKGEKSPEQLLQEFLTRCRMEIEGTMPDNVVPLRSKVG